MNTELDLKVERLLRRAASRRGVVSYGAFHALFAQDVPLRERYALLEAAATALCEPRVADYASLLATDSGLPGPEFYVRFKRLHTERYYATLGADRHRMLRLVEKRALAREERERVYDHYRHSLAPRACTDAGANALCSEGRAQRL
ncbi:hypothetical protein ACFPTO_08680 [Paraburkholderia denitrificans]|uniref:Uncharacterized protein n=1 Tax=Paraburkholderia denitrificans TaxID=694025 RepID=A0ABW0J793_9BURK